MFEFARNLPENRCIDFQLHNIGGKQKTIEPVSGDECQNANANANTNGNQAKVRVKKPKSEFRTPFEMYREANPEMKFNDARVNFSALKEKKIVKYIKEAEAIYDAVILFHWFSLLTF